MVSTGRHRGVVPLPLTAENCPSKLVPFPYGTTGTRYLLAMRMTACTSSVDAGNTTALGGRLTPYVHWLPPWWSRSSVSTVMLSGPKTPCSSRTAAAYSAGEPYLRAMPGWVAYTPADGAEAGAEVEAGGAGEAGAASAVRVACVPA
jgi:hypothetical protein